MSIEDIIAKGAEVANKRDKRRVEVGQAEEATNKKIEETAQADSAILDEQTAIDELKNAVAEYTPDGDIESLIMKAQRVQESRGKRVIEVNEMQEAVATALRETAEAESANFDEDAAINELKELANSYTKE